MNKTFDLLCMGRSSLDLFGDKVGTHFDDQTGFRAYVGGSPTNICVAAQRLGLKTALLTGMGDDYVRGFLLKFLDGEGINTQSVIFKPGLHTNTVLVALQPPIEMQFVAYHANNADLEITIDDVLNAPVAASRGLLFTGMCLLKEPSRSATQYAADFARTNQTKVFMDLDYRAPMWPDVRVYGITTRITLPLVDIAMGTVEEVCGAAGTDSLDGAVEKLLRLVNEALIVKHGESGSTVYTLDGQVHPIDPFQTTVVNFLGAGDAFAGGFIYSYLNSKSIPEAARFGNACGAYIVAQHGTANALPTLEQVQAFIQQF